MTPPLWTPATPDDLIAWGQGYTAGYDTGHSVGYTDGRALGYVAGREGLAGDLLTALRIGLSGVSVTGDVRGTDIAEVLSRPFGDLINDHIRMCDQATRRRAWDAANRLEVHGA